VEAPTAEAVPAEGEPLAGTSSARTPDARAQAEPIDLLAVTGVRAAVARFVPYLLVFLAGAVVGGVLGAWLS
jgi:hypothetical protein